MSNLTKSDDRDVFIVWAKLVTEISSEINAGDTWNATSPGPEDYLTTLVDNVSRSGNNNSNNSNMSSSSSSSNSIVLDMVIHWSGFKVGVLIGTLLILFETVIGNVLVISAVLTDKKLQTPFNYYIVNLAMCDMNVGLSVMTLFVAHNLYEFFPFDSLTCAYWIWSDWTMTFESVATLTAISIDRFWSVTWTLHYRNNNSGRKSLLIIAMTWLYVNTMWLPAFIHDRVYNEYDPGHCEWDTFRNLKSVTVIAVLGYYLPLTVMVSSYIRIFVVMKRRSNAIGHNKKQEVPTVSGEVSATMQPTNEAKQPKFMAAAMKNEAENARARKDKKAFYTLGVLVLLFLICWIPFYAYMLISPFVPDFFPGWYIEFSYWMAYLNSAINPILYSVNDDFRRAIKKIVLCRFGR